MATSESMAIFKAASAQIGKELAVHGFKFSSSKRAAVRNGRLFEHSITFSTSRSVNSLPGHIAFNVNATAWSEGFGEYRRKNGVALPINEACLFDTTIENLFKAPPPYIRYDIGDPNNRDQILESIKSVLQNDVVMVFDLIEQPRQLEEYMAVRAILCLETFNAWRDYKSYVSANDLA